MKILASVKTDGKHVYIIGFVKSGNYSTKAITVDLETGSLRSYELSDLIVVDDDYRY